MLHRKIISQFTSHGNALDHEFTGIKFLISHFREKKIVSSWGTEKTFTTLTLISSIKRASFHGNLTSKKGVYLMIPGSPQEIEITN